MGGGQTSAAGDYNILENAELRCPRGGCFLCQAERCDPGERPLLNCQKKPLPQYLNPKTSPEPQTSKPIIHVFIPATKPAVHWEERVLLAMLYQKIYDPNIMGVSHI